MPLTWWRTPAHRPSPGHRPEESEIRPGTGKTEAVEVLAEERLYRWVNWQVTEKSSDHTKLDAQNIEFRVTVPRMVRRSSTTGRDTRGSDGVRSGQRADRS